MDGFNNEMMNNLKNIMGEDQVNKAISQISPEMIENFSNMMNQNNNSQDNKQSNNDSFNGSDFGNIDVETIMKIKKMLDKVNNNKNDPRSNLLNSLKPYMRESRQENIDKYANLLKFAEIANLLNNR